MKREQMIDRLVKAGVANSLSLRYWTNEKVEKTYLRVHQEQLHWECTCRWSQRWVHPKKQYPLTAPTDQELAALLIKKRRDSSLIGEGKYDDLCTEAREKAMACGAILIIIDGNKGWGFSVQAPIWEMTNLPNALRSIADTIESDLKKGKL